MDNTILFGNGINRLTASNISWGHLLDLLKGGRKFNDGNLPNTMIYERIILERPLHAENVLYDEITVKEEIAAFLSEIAPNELYTEIFKLNVQNYLTTNYDYGYLNSLLHLAEVLTPIQEFGTEDVYSIRRLKSIRNTKQETKHFWQIHGEIRKPATIMLGLDHYCGSIGKIDTYIKGGYKYNSEGETINELSIIDKFQNNQFSNSSWVELFFTSNIHIISFSLDYSEIDLWWILNKRARMKRNANIQHLIKNKIVFHCHSIAEQMKGVLESMDVHVELTELPNTENKYLDYHEKLVKRLRREL